MHAAEQQPGLRIAAVARRTGVGVATLRAWEERYGLLEPARTAGGQRLYTEQDVARVWAVKKLVAEGWSHPAAVAQVRKDNAPASGPLEDDLEGLVALHRASRRLLRARSVAELSAALSAFVADVGGEVCEPDDPAAAVHVDVTLGSGPAMVAAAAPGTTAIRRLRAGLPGLAEDARHLAEILRRVPPAEIRDRPLPAPPGSAVADGPIAGRADRRR